jgi:hypothetical protein
VRGLEATVGLPEVATSDLVPQIEDNEVAHVNCVIRLRDDADEDSIEGVKTVIVARLWNGCRGPLTHTCHMDTDLVPHPSNRLETPPLGMYLDDRSVALRAWCLARYWLLMLARKVQSRYRAESSL